MKKIVFLFLILISCSKFKEDDQKKISSVGKEVITYEEFERYLLENIGDDPYRHTATVLSEFLDNYIKEKLLYNEAVRKGFRGKEKLETINNFIENICSKIEKPSEKLILEFYETHKDKFKTQNEFYFWEIFITDKEIAENVYLKAKNGDDFQKLTMEFSENLNKERGGLIGPLSIDDIPEEIALSLSKLKRNEISPLLPVSGGYMILKLKEIKPTRNLSFEEAKNLIYDYLKEERCQNKLEEYQKSLVLKETIWIYQKNLPFSYCGQFPLYQQ